MAAGEAVCGARVGLLRGRCCSREPAVEAHEQGREGGNAVRPQRRWKERGSPRERHSTKFLAIRKPIKVAGLRARLRERTYPEKQGVGDVGRKKFVYKTFWF